MYMSEYFYRHFFQIMGKLTVFEMPGAFSAHPDFKKLLRMETLKNLHLVLTIFFVKKTTTISNLLTKLITVQSIWFSNQIAYYAHWRNYVPCMPTQKTDLSPNC